MKNCVLSAYSFPLSWTLSIVWGEYRIEFHKDRLPYCLKQDLHVLHYEYFHDFTTCGIPGTYFISFLRRPHISTYYKQDSLIRSIKVFLNWDFMNPNAITGLEVKNTAQPRVKLLWSQWSSMTAANKGVKANEKVWKLVFFFDSKYIWEWNQ